MLRLRKNLAKLATLGVAVGGLTLVGAQAAGADFAINVSPQSGTASANPFFVTLPGTAKCSGDTATGGYHLYSYVVPGSVDPRTLNFSTGAASTGQALIDTGGTPYEAVATGVTSGSVPTLPQFSWSAYVGDFGTGHDLFPGTWNIGVACANTAGQIDIPGSTGNNGGENYWNFSENFAASGTAGDFAWSVIPASLTPEAPLAIALPLSAVALGGAAAFVLRRRRRSAAPAHT